MKQWQPGATEVVKLAATELAAVEMGEVAAMDMGGGGGGQG